MKFLLCFLFICYNSSMFELMKIKNECSVCSTDIWEFDGAKRKKTSEYNEIITNLNDNTKMRVGVCSRHTQPKELEFKIMSEKCRQGWLEEVALGIGNSKWVNSTGSKLDITGMRG